MSQVPPSFFGLIRRVAHGYEPTREAAWLRSLRAGGDTSQLHLDPLTPLLGADGALTCPVQRYSATIRQGLPRWCSLPFFQRNSRDGRL
jgi:hypothetical protein